jgi:acetyl esterase/lipase
MKNILLLVCILFQLQTFGQRYSKAVFANVTNSNNIQYGQANNYLGLNTNLLLDFYQPSGDTILKRPLIVFIHGGGFIDVTETKSLSHIIAFADSFAKRGYVVASIDYRLDISISNRSVINAMHDARTAIRYLKSNAALYKIDTNNVFAAGESAGAVTALNVNYLTTNAEAAYPNSIPTNASQTMEGPNGNGGISSKTKSTICLCGGTKTIFNQDMFDTTTIKSASNPPLLMIHGTADPLIPIARALEVAVRATNIGVPNLFYTFQGATHCPWYGTLPNGQQYLDSMVNYVSTFLDASLNSTSIKQFTKANISIYPNPAEEILHVQSSEAIQSILVLDLQGKIIHSQNTKNQSNIIIDTKNFNSNVYFLKINTETRKITKQ